MFVRWIRFQCRSNIYKNRIPCYFQILPKWHKYEWISGYHVIKYVMPNAIAETRIIVSYILHYTHIYMHIYYMYVWIWWYCRWNNSKIDENWIFKSSSNCSMFFIHESNLRSTKWPQIKSIGLLQDCTRIVVRISPPTSYKSVFVMIFPRRTTKQKR